MRDNGINKTLIDTSSWVHALRASGMEDVRRRVAGLVTSGEAVWCDAVRLELWNGARGSLEKQRLHEFEEELPSLAMNDKIWNLAFTFARKARGAGLTIPAIDLLVFACARGHEVFLEHSDEHFRHLEKLIPMQAKGN